MNSQTVRSGPTCLTGGDYGLDDVTEDEDKGEEDTGDSTAPRKKTGPPFPAKADPIPEYGLTLPRLLTRTVFQAIQLIHRRIDSAAWIRRRNRRPDGEKTLEYEDPVGEVYCPVVVGVGRVEAGW